MLVAFEHKKINDSMIYLVYIMENNKQSVVEPPLDPTLTSPYQAKNAIGSGPTTPLPGIRAASTFYKMAGLSAVIFLILIQFMIMTGAGGIAFGMAAISLLPFLLISVVISFIVAARIKLAAWRRHEEVSPIHTLMLGLCGFLTLLMASMVIFAIYTYVSREANCQDKLQNGEYVKRDELFAHNDEAAARGEQDNRFIGWSSTECSELLEPTRKYRSDEPLNPSTRPQEDGKNPADGKSEIKIDPSSDNPSPIE